MWKFSDCVHIVIFLFLSFEHDLEIARECAVYTPDSLQSMSNKLIGDGFVME